MNLGKKTKIVCTIGPATESVEKMVELIEAGMNVARLNFSHGDFEEQGRRVENLKQAMEKTGKIVAIMQDLCGPKIRIGTFKDGMIELKKGDKFTLTTDEIEGTVERVHVNYAELPKEVKAGSTISLQDGTKKLKVVEVRGNDIITEVVVGGHLANKRGVNVPGANLSICSLTDKDKKDIEFGVKNRVDFVAISFVRKATDVKELKAILKERGLDSQIIAKIETPEALSDIDGILEEADGIMIARGDLAIEIPAAEVPLAQKLLIRRSNALGKPVITATQMMESMIDSPVPTRAEISDVANAIIDGTDAIMLSEETALGKYPKEAVLEMSQIAQRIEQEVYTRDIIAEYEESHGVTDTVSQSAVRMAHAVGAKFIVALTRTGKTARMVARYRPAERILALTDAPENANKLLLSFGCYPLVVPTFGTVDEIMAIAREAALKNGLAKEGDKVIIVAGMPFGASSETNFVMVETL